VSYHEFISLLGFIMRMLTMIFAGVFVVRYSRRRWRTLPEGRHLMGFSLVVFLFMVWSTVNTYMAWSDEHPPQVNPDGDWYGREEVAVILFGFTAFYMYQRNKLLVPEEKARDAKEAEDRLHDDRVTSTDQENGVEKWQS
jgi:amino acid transporter